MKTQERVRPVRAGGGASKVDELSDAQAHRLLGRVAGTAWELANVGPVTFAQWVEGYERFVRRNRALEALRAFAAKLRRYY